ncbi:MAG: hypothetical protein GY913_14060 [Proteobacteria bacterium]|nr:hypothetical protein [Pseudomonadota bacterium]MCP4918033.1 hypothetical protein [Pseudomonadota bacterium]
MERTKPVIVVVSRKASIADQVAMVLTGRFDVHHARSAKYALPLLEAHKPLVVAMGLQDIDQVSSLREVTGCGCLFVAHGKLPYDHKLRGAPKASVLEKLGIDDFVSRELSGQDLATVVWSHVAAAIRSVPKRQGQSRRTEDQTWGALLTSEASMESFRKLLTKNVVDAHELAEDDDPTWSELLTAKVSTTAFKKLFTKKW